MKEYFNYPSQLPKINTALPGPKTKELIACDHANLSPSYTRDYPLTVKRGLGVGIEDLDGNWFLDFTAGIAVTNTGHCHPKVVAAIQDQAQHLVHMSGTDFYYEPMVALAEKLTRLAPGPSEKKVFFTNSGTEAVEAAIKLARYRTKRTRIIAFEGSFHGRTYGALSLTSSKVQQRRGFTPLLPEVHHAIYGDLKSIERMFERTIPPEEVAAIFVEPIQGEGGYIVPPQDFLLGLRNLCDKHGILLVADEVQSGMGRSGKMFAMEHWNVAPDIICVAKGLASGMPLGAIIARSDVMNWAPGSHGSTFAGNPVCCRAGLETVELLENEYIKNSEERGEELRQGLRGLSEKHKLLGEVRGLGLMTAIVITDKSKKMDVINKAFEKGLLLLGCGDNAIRFSPALCVTSEQIQTAVKLFDAAVAAV